MNNRWSSAFEEALRSEKLLEALREERASADTFTHFPDTETLYQELVKLRQLPLVEEMMRQTQYPISLKMVSSPKETTGSHFGILQLGVENPVEFFLFGSGEDSARPMDASGELTFPGGTYNPLRQLIEDTPDRLACMEELRGLVYKDIIDIWRTEEENKVHTIECVLKSAEQAVQFVIHDNPQLPAFVREINYTKGMTAQTRVQAMLGEGHIDVYYEHTSVHPAKSNRIIVQTTSEEDASYCGLIPWDLASGDELYARAGALYDRALESVIMSDKNE